MVLQRQKMFFLICLESPYLQQRFLRVPDLSFFRDEFARCCGVVVASAKYLQQRASALYLASGVLANF
jgi:hypothetical protein